MMRIKILSLGLSLVLLILSLIHVYWALGGRWALGKVVPTSGNCVPLFKPSKTATLTVTSGLLFLVWIVLQKIDIEFRYLPENSLSLLYLIFGAIFILRAVGDLRLVGFFAKSSGSDFNYWDKRLYSPLSLAIGISFLILAGG